MRFLLFAIVLLLFGEEASSQGDVLFNKVELDAEIDISVVSAITQDEAGYIWIASEEGVLRYDSYKAHLYNEYAGLPASFSNKISTLYHYDHELWIASDNNLAKYDHRSDTFVEAEIPDAVSIIYDILIKDDYMYLAAFNGMWKLPRDSMSSGQQVLEGKAVNCLYDDDWRILFGAKPGLYQYDLNKGIAPINEDLVVMSMLLTNREFVVGTFGGELLQLGNDGRVERVIAEELGPVYDILWDPNEGKYYVGADGGGVNIFDDQMQQITQALYDANDENSLSSNGVYDLLVDRNDQIWVATYGGGVNTFRKGGYPFTIVDHVPNEEQSISNSFTRAILETKENEIWYGTKEGISIFDPTTDLWRHKRALSADSKSDIVMALAEDGDYIWVATYGSGLFKVEKNSLRAIEYSPRPQAAVTTSLDRVYAVMKAEGGKIYYGGIEGPCHVIDGDEISTLSFGQVRDITQGPGGEIIFVGRSGVHILKDGNIERQDKLHYQDTEFDYSTINCAVFQNEDIVWIGTNGDGIIKYNINTKDYNTYNISNGLPSDIVQGIVIQNDVLWASTSRGLVRMHIDGQVPSLEVYDQGDGIKYTSFNYGSYESFGDGRIAFGSTQGVVFVDPTKLSQSSESPPVYFEKLTVLNTDEGNLGFNLLGKSEANDAVKLNYKQNFVKVDFTGIDHLYPDKLRFSWQMEGLNKQWSKPSSERSVSFAGLNPGKYTFNLKAIDRYGLESDIKQTEFIITPPWWQSWWAYVLYSLMFLGLLYGGVVIVRTVLRQKTADEQISFYNNITHELKTPLSILLTKLEHASNSSENIGEIKTTVKRMNGLFDQLLNFNKVSSDYYRNQKVSKISFAKHINVLVETFQQELERKNITFTFTNDWPYEHFYYKRDALDKITYNLISNAVKYSDQGGAVLLHAEEDQGKLKMTVKDNGIGIPKDQHADILKRYYRARNAVNSQAPGTGLGLMIVKNLVEYDGGKISFTSEEGLGSAFTIVIPSLEEKYVEDAQPSQDSIPANLEDKERSSALPKARVLIVEDNDELRIDLAEKLSEHFGIAAARNGVEGFEKAKAKLPDLIITDLIMPEMDGNQLCEALQKDEDTNHIPVFMMTVLNSASQKVESIKSGVTSYMTKPIDFPFLVAKIDSVLEYKQKLREKYLHETELETAHKFKDDREAEFVKKMEDFIIEKIKEENISVQDLCKHMGMSRTALYTRLKDMIDMSLQNFIITTRMNHARKLLLQGGVTVKEVAFQVGFNNPKYFSTSFKKQFGESPSGFLKSLNPT